MPTVNLHSIKKATQDTPLGDVTAEELAFARRAAAVLQEIVQDARFLDWVARSDFSETGMIRHTAETGREQENPESVANIIYCGRELIEKFPDDTSIDLPVVLADLTHELLADTDPFVPRIGTDVDFFRRCVEADDPVALAAVWMHEWMHLAGFIHFVPQRRDPLDVPHVVEFLVQELGRVRKAEGAGRPAPVTAM